MTAIDTYRDRLIFEQSVRDGQTFRKKIRAWPTVLDRKKRKCWSTRSNEPEKKKKKEEKVPECSDCQGPYNKAVSRYDTIGWW